MVLPVPTPTEITLLGIIAPVVAALAFVLVCALLREPARGKLSAILVAGAGAVYAAGGFGVAEIAFCALLTVLAYKGFDSYRMIGSAWLLHGVWDLAHDLWGNPILPYVAESSFACLVFDLVVATWYMLGAPSPWRPILAEVDIRQDAACGDRHPGPKAGAWE
jgi:hypothetical protein